MLLGLPRNVDTQVNILGDRIGMLNRGGAVFVAVFSSIVALFAAVAVYNLMHGAALTKLEVGGSVVWLLLVLLWIVGALVEAGGPRQLIAGIFARRAFVELQRGISDPPVLRYGFELFNKSFSYDPIDINRIGMVTWNPGQASDMSGRDCRDWAVAVWYVPDGNAIASKWDRANLRGKRIRIVTPSLPKEDANAIGQSLVALLQSAGIGLVSTGEHRPFAGEFTIKTPGSPLVDSHVKTV
jgi:hypothetical protein